MGILRSLPALACVLRSVNTVRQVGLQIDNSGAWMGFQRSVLWRWSPSTASLIGASRTASSSSNRGSVQPDEIRAMDGCEVVRGTAEEVNESELDYYGRYFDKAKKFTRG